MELSLNMTVLAGSDFPGSGWQVTIRAGTAGAATTERSCQHHACIARYLCGLRGWLVRDVLQRDHFTPLRKGHGKGLHVGDTGKTKALSVAVIPSLEREGHCIAIALMSQRHQATA